MQRDIVDPAPLRVGRNQFHLAVAIEANQFAVIAAQNQARTIRRRAQNAAAVDGDRRDLARFVDQENLFLGTHKGGALAKIMLGRVGGVGRYGRFSVLFVCAVSAVSANRVPFGTLRGAFGTIGTNGTALRH